MSASQSEDIEGTGKEGRGGGGNAIMMSSQAVEVDGVVKANGGDSWVGAWGSRGRGGWWWESLGRVKGNQQKRQSYVAECKLGGGYRGRCRAQCKAYVRDKGVRIGGGHH